MEPAGVHAAARARPRERGLGGGGRRRRDDGREGRRGARVPAATAAASASPAAAATTCTASTTSSPGLTVDGGFADYVLVPERSLVRLPDGVEPAAVAPHADAGLTAYHAVRRLAHLAMPGTTAVVIGVGGVGHIALQLLRELGSSSTIADRHRRAAARARHGARRRRRARRRRTRSTRCAS